MAEPTPTPILEITTVSHAYGSTQALEGIDLAMAPGELMCLVGPSGCGKSTLLRLAAGLESVQRGQVRIDGRVVAGDGPEVPPEERGVGMVFQDYALFPHLSVIQNVAFGLRGESAARRRERARAVLRKFGVEGLAESYPHMLSGGEQQRVALARALAPEPRILLLDEPFSGLDARLRDHIRDETLHVLKNSGAATLLVTHDPEEAMFMADRIAVMRASHIAQVGRPVEIYFHPVNAFVATFFSDVNRLAATVRDGHVETPFGRLKAGGFANGDQVQILIRPEALYLAWAGEGEHTRNIARVRAARLLGRSTLIHLDIENDEGVPMHMHSRVPKHVGFGEGDEVTVTLDVSQAYIFPLTDPTTAQGG
jgi:iron(III) transport system ATP-binding protein